MSYIRSKVADDNLLSAEDAGYAITFDDEEYYTQSETDSKYVHLDGSQAMTSDLDVGSNKVINVANPTASNDGVNKDYLDSNYLDKTTANSKYVHLDGSQAMTSDLDMGNNNILNAEQMIMREVSINDDSYFTISPIDRTSGKLLVILSSNVVEVMYDMSGDQYAKVSELGTLFSTYTGVANGTAGNDSSFNLFFDSNGGSPRIHLENRTGSTTNARYCVYS